jgi:anti-sigma regulatory factor (Ser/Thr protein kinase)
MPVDALVLAVDPASPSVARTFVAGLLRRRGYDRELVEDAELMVSELATNAVVHVGEPFTVAVNEVERGVCVSVEDPSSALPVLRAPGSAAEGGRGLRIVEALAADWGALALERGGKAVWFLASPTVGAPSAIPRPTEG